MVSQRVKKQGTEQLNQNFWTVTQGSGTWAWGMILKKVLLVGSCVGSNNATWVRAGEGGGLGLSKVVLF